MLPIAALVMLVTASTWIAHPRTIYPVSSQVMSRADLTLEAVPTVRPVQPSISTRKMNINEGTDYGPVASSTVGQPAVAPTPAEPPPEGSLLPEHRILLIYGLPGDPGYGMLGSYENLRLLEILQGEREKYEGIEPHRPVVIGLQIIASAAQKSPGQDGSYLRDTSIATIYQHIEFTRANDMLLFLDLQIGRRSVPEEAQRMNRYLLEPHVHLAIDPEFDVGRTEIPTQDIGSTSAADIRWVQDYLVALTAQAGIPPKVLIVHQWAGDQIINRTLLRPVRGVQLVISVSQWGDIKEKTAAFTSLGADDPVEFGGIMISGVWDSEPMSTDDVINLPNAPEIVIYQ